MIRPFGAGREHFLLHIERIQQRAATAQQQITSGYKVQKLSDSAARMPEIVELQARIASSTQSLSNLENAKSEVDRNEASLQQAVKMLQEIVVTGGQGITASATPEDRKMLAERIKEWHASLVRTANQDYNGRYQFGGDRDDIPPYSVDWNQPGGIIRAHNQPDTRLVEDAAGNRFSISRRAQDIFDLRDTTDGFAPENVFNAVHTLALALDNNDPDSAADAIGMVKASAVHLNNELSAYGHYQNRVTESINQARRIQLRATTELAGITEADLPSAILEFTQANTNLQAALGAQAKVSQVSLFDYLG